MSKTSKKKVKHKGSSLKKWKVNLNESDTFWFQNMTTSGQNSPKMMNKLNTTAPINFSQLGMKQYMSGKGFKDSSIKQHSNLEKTMSFGTNTKRSFSNRYYTDSHGGKLNSNSIITKTKTTKFKKISSNRGSTKPSAMSNHRKNNSIKIRKRNNKLREVSFEPVQFKPDKYYYREIETKCRLPPQVLLIELQMMGVQLRFGIIRRLNTGVL